MALESSRFSWRRLHGSKIHFLSINFGILKGLPPLLREFEAETGIDVTFETVPAADYRRRLALAKEGAAVMPDVYLQELDVSSYLDHCDGWSLDLASLLGSPEMTCDDFDAAGLAPCLDAATLSSAPGRPVVLGIPFAVEAYLLFYNKDLLARYQVPPPKTMDEWVRASRQIVRDSRGKHHGTVLRGSLAPANIDVLTAMAMNACHDTSGPPGNVWFDGDWSRPRAADPRVLKALDWYAQLLATGPASYGDLGCVAARKVFTEGESGFFMDASLMVTDLEGEAISKLSGGIGCLPLPAADPSLGGRTGYWMLGLGIPARAKDVSAAWYLVQWLTHRRQGLRLALDHGGPSRPGLWQEPSLHARFGADFTSSIAQALGAASSTSVFHPRWGEMATAILQAVHQRVEGKALDRIGRELNETLRNLAGGINAA
ncbi:extracellular solute-binding protein [Aquabacterium sp. A7-Y]|uniref:ABC transporter substrate-binding protein n=1 Tax=Aquabacterium sp. A7-Y TaxID=1349605 RepID=UPI00223D9F4A|nr:extracellular solute-binding protein [Aquabacterium sp. A7-Y]MCW7536792.1 extracellular solute-binding protein [Aquabacterium sp. A7-Y]